MRDMEKRFQPVGCAWHCIIYFPGAEENIQAVRSIVNITSSVEET